MEQGKRINEYIIKTVNTKKNWAVIFLYSTSTLENYLHFATNKVRSILCIVHRKVQILMQGLEILYCSFTKWESDSDGSWVDFQRGMESITDVTRARMFVCVVKSLRTMYIFQVCKQRGRQQMGDHHISRTSENLRHFGEIQHQRSKENLHFTSRVRAIQK